MRNRLFLTVMLAPTLVLLLLFYGYPVVENLRMSFTDLAKSG